MSIADWTERDARALADKILGHSKAPECELTLTRVRSSHTRFAANDVTTSGSVEDLRITITSRGNRRSGTRHRQRAATRRRCSERWPSARS